MKANAGVERTTRGFGIFGRVQLRKGGSLRVQESSRVFDGAHCWIFYDGVQCVDHLGHHMPPHPEITTAEARALIAALQNFVAAVEADETMEPEAPTT